MGENPKCWSGKLHYLTLSISTDINPHFQLCVSPDYVLVPKTSLERFVALLHKAFSSFFPEGALSSPDMGRIVSQAHFSRLTSLLSATKGKLVAGGSWGPGGENAQDRGIETTIVVFEDLKQAVNDVLLEGELFGPILPVVGIENLDEG